MKRTYLIATLVACLFSLGCQKEEPSQPGNESSIAGIITVDGDLREHVSPDAILFIIARKEVGPPLAVQRIARPQFPLAYALSQQDAMIPGTVMQGEVFVKVRLDRDGNAGPLEAGDLTGQVKRSIPVGSSDVNVTIDTLH